MDGGPSAGKRIDSVDTFGLKLFKRHCEHFRHQEGVIGKWGGVGGGGFPMPQKFHQVGHIESVAGQCRLLHSALAVR